MTAAALAAALGAVLEGDGSRPVRRPAAPADAGPDDVVVAMEPKFARGLTDCPARVAVLWPGADWRALGFAAAIFVPRPRYAMAGITAAFDVPHDLDPGMHPSAIVHPTAEIGADASIGAFVTIGRGAVIGPRARIFGHVSIAEGVEIGADALILHGVRIARRVHIGDRFIAQPNAVIGADGFSFVTPGRGAVEEAKATGRVTDATRATGFARIASIGSVRIGDDVEVGAGTCIDRGTIADTVIGPGTKIDNLVQIGHNVTVGAMCLLCGQVGIAGSAAIGDRVVLGGKVGVADHLRIGSDVLVAAGSLVATNVPARSVMMGIPAQPRDRAVEAIMLQRRLPELARRLDALPRAPEKPVSNSDPTG